MNDFFRKILCYAFVFFGASFAEANEFEARRVAQMGPNLHHNVRGNMPLAWGSWVPQGQVMLDFNWFEPLEAVPYGSVVTDTNQYLRVQGTLDVSPFYAQIKAAIGLALFKANPHAEARIVYSNMLFIGSNVEMAMGNRTDEPRASKTWHADYIFDRLYDESSADQIQSFGFWVDFNFKISSMRMWASLGYTYLDVSTDYDGKSYDYSRGLPVYSRDDVFTGKMHTAFAAGEHWDWFFDFTYCGTGYLEGSAGEYSKEPLSYALLLSGPSWFWDQGRSRISFAPGVWQRWGEDSFDGSVWEQFIVQLNYQGTWHLSFH